MERKHQLLGSPRSLLSDVLEEWRVHALAALRSTSALRDRLLCGRVLIRRARLPASRRWPACLAGGAAGGLRIVDQAGCNRSDHRAEARMTHISCEHSHVALEEGGGPADVRIPIVVEDRAKAGAGARGERERPNDAALEHAGDIQLANTLNTLNCEKRRAR
jgi:hypothetical protein